MRGRSVVLFTNCVCVWGGGGGVCHAVQVLHWANAVGQRSSPAAAAVGRSMMVPTKEYWSQIVWSCQYIYTSV